MSTTQPAVLLFLFLDHPGARESVLTGLFDLRENIQRQTLLYRLFGSKELD